MGIAALAAAFLACQPAEPRSETPFRVELVALGLCSATRGILDGCDGARPSGSPEFSKAATLARQIENAWEKEPSRIERDLAFVESAQGKPEMAAERLLASKSCGANASCLGELAAYLAEAGARRGDAELLLQSLVQASRAIEIEPSQRMAKFNLDLGLSLVGLDVAPSAKGAESAVSVGATTGPANWQERARALQNTAIPVELAELQALAENSPQFARQVGTELLLADAARAANSMRAEEARVLAERALCLGESVASAGGDQTLELSAREVQLAIAEGTPAALDFLTAVERYGRSRVKIREESYEIARASLTPALEVLKARGSVLYPWARHALAVSERFVGRDRQGEFESQIRELPNSAPALRAHLFWSVAVLADLRGDLPTAIRRFNDAIEQFDRLGEVENAATVRSFRAFPLLDMGREREAGADLLWALRGREQFASFDTLEVVIDSWLALFVSPQFPSVAHYFQEELVEAARLSDRPSMLVQALLVRAENRLEPLPLRLRSLDEAEAAIAAIEEPAERARKLSMVDAARASALLAVNAASSLSFSNRSLEYLAAPSRKALRLPVLELRADALVRLGSVAEGSEAFRDAITLLENTLGNATSYEQRLQMLLPARALFRKLAELQLEQGEGAGTIAATLRRGQSLMVPEASRRERHRPRDASSSNEPPTRLAEKEALLEFAELGGQVVLLETTATELRFQRLGLSSEKATAASRELEEALRTDDRARAEKLGGVLGRELLASLKSMRGLAVRIVPGPLLESLPWGALIDPASEQPLIVSRAFSLLPTSELPRRAGREVPGRRASGTCRVVGAPELSAELRTVVGTLEAARIESNSVAGLYPGAEIRLGEAASPAALLAQPAARLLHVAAHGLVGRTSEEFPRLALAPDAEHPTGLLSAVEIAAADLRGVHVAVLAACNSSRGPVGANEVPLSLAAAFLFAGAEHVLASVRPIEDRATAEFVVRFHRHLLSGVDPATALQRTAIESREISPDRPSIWSAFVMWG